MADGHGDRGAFWELRPVHLSVLPKEFQEIKCLEGPAIEAATVGIEKESGQGKCPDR